jgi:hypothetical protein
LPAVERLLAAHAAPNRLLEPPPTHR